MQLSEQVRTGYVLKVYPRFSETFIVTEILAREAAGEDIHIFSLRQASDPRFHPELARVQAPVTYLGRPARLAEGWMVIAEAERTVPGFGASFARMLPGLTRADAGEVHQGIELAVQATRRGITHLHAHFGSLAARTAAIAAALAGIRFSFTAHAKDLFHEAVDEDVLRSLMASASHVVTVSDFNAGFLRAIAPDSAGKVRRIYNGLELGRFPYLPPSALHSPLRIAAVGRLVEKKGFRHLIDAVAALQAAGVSTVTRIAGGGELEEDLAGRIARLGLERSVELLGPRTQNEVIELLRWADVFVAPCVVGADGNTDGLPTVLLEAMALGVPVVASAVTGIPEVVGHDDGGRQTGILTVPGSTGELVAALQEVTRPGFDRIGMAGAARRLVERNFDAAIQSAALRDLQYQNTAVHSRSQPGRATPVDFAPADAALSPVLTQSAGR